MKILLTKVTDNKDIKEIVKSTVTLETQMYIDTSGMLMIGEKEIDLNKIDFVIIDDKNYSNKEFFYIHHDLYEVFMEILKKNGMLNIILENRIYKDTEFKTLMIYSY